MGSAPSTRERRFVPNNRPSGSQKTVNAENELKTGSPKPPGLPRRLPLPA
jgi:hypothetical protein